MISPDFDPSMLTKEAVSTLTLERLHDLLVRDWSDIKRIIGACSFEEPKNEGCILSDGRLAVAYPVELDDGPKIHVLLISSEGYILSEDDDPTKIDQFATICRMKTVDIRHWGTAAFYLDGRRVRHGARTLWTLMPKVSPIITEIEDLIHSIESARITTTAFIVFDGNTSRWMIKTEHHDDAVEIDPEDDPADVAIEVVLDAHDPPSKIARAVRTYFHKED